MAVIDQLGIAVSIVECTKPAKTCRHEINQEDHDVLGWKIPPGQVSYCHLESIVIPNTEFEVGMEVKPPPRYISYLTLVIHINGEPVHRCDFDFRQPGPRPRISLIKETREGFLFGDLPVNENPGYQYPGPPDVILERKERFGEIVVTIHRSRPINDPLHNSNCKTLRAKCLEGCAEASGAFVFLYNSLASHVVTKDQLVKQDEIK